MFKAEEDLGDWSLLSSAAAKEAICQAAFCYYDGCLVAVVVAGAAILSTTI